MLTSLRHRTVRSGNDQDRTVHLRSTSDHVLDIVSVSWAVNVRIVALFSLIFYVCGIDGNTTFFFFRRTVDHVIVHCLRFTALSQDVSDCSRQRSLTMVDVTDGTDIHMRFRSVKFFFSHFSLSS